eukprot:GEMP01046078.1.p1 GENE.GEMP01046078.1~~GEMP01046078.1.p1  ORF type:complete len:224 (+),score=35.38 GEMP01046078.1:186-857(+)
MVPLTRLAFGSCNAVHNIWCTDLTKDCNYLPQPMWPHIIRRQPDVWIWLGDAVYGDYPETFSQLNGDFTPASPERMREMYRRQKASKGYKEFLETNVTVLGVWDDHDYGVNNGDFSYVHKDESKDAFREFIGGTWPNDAQYTSHRFNLNGIDTHVILLDVRLVGTTLETNSGSGSRKKCGRKRTSSLSAVEYRSCPCTEPPRTQKGGKIFQMIDYDLWKFLDR